MEKQSITSSEELRKKLLADIQVVEAALRILYQAVDNLVSACTADDGSIKSPSKEDVLNARKLLPPEYKNTLSKKKPQK